MVSEILAHDKVVSSIEMLAAWIESQMAYRGQPGLSIGIVHDQELVWARGFGYADVERKVKTTPRTIYRIASNTKLFTSTAILQLRDGGKLRLDDPIRLHLPWFEIQNTHPDTPPITIRHLLTHTSGLPRESPYPYWTDNMFPTSEQVKEALPGQESVLPTEKRWKYSNLALTLAGEIVVAVSGQRYVEYIKTHILEPLNMNSTYVESPDSDNPHLATGYGRRLPNGKRAASPFTDCKGITPAANMSSTVEDLAQFAMLQFREDPKGGKQILRGSTLREMHRVHWLQPDWMMGWGLGFNIVRFEGRTYIGHGGSVKGYRTLIRINEEDKIAVIVLTNADDGNPLMYVEKAFQWVAPSIMECVTPQLEAEGLVSEWTMYTGKYRNSWSDLQVLVLEGELVMIDPSQPDPTLTLTKLTPVSEHIFTMESKSGYGSHGERVIFELNNQGKVKRVKVGANYSYPVEEW